MKTFRELVSAVAILCTLWLTGCGSVNFMRKAEPNEILSAPPAGKALVNFHRPSNFGGAVDLPIFDREKLIGNCEGNCRFQYVCDPGEHIFIARREQVTVIQADLLSGKTYDIVVDIGMGWIQANIKLAPITRSEERRKLVEAWESSERVIVFVPDERALDFEKRNQKRIQDTLKDFIGGPKQNRVQRLAGNDARGSSP